MGCCKVKCSLCTAQQVWWSLHWVLWQGWAGGLRGVRFCCFLEFFSCKGAAGQPQCIKSWQSVSGQPWVCHSGVLQGQMLPLQCAAGVVEPTLGAATELGRWFVGVAVLPVLGEVPEEEAALGNHSAQSPASA